MVDIWLIYIVIICFIMLTIWLMMVHNNLDGGAILPSWKLMEWKSMGFGWHPINMKMEKNPFMFQTTNFRFIEFAYFSQTELNILHLRGISLLAVIPYLGYPVDLGLPPVAALQSCETPRHIVMIKVPRGRSPVVESNHWLVVGWWLSHLLGGSSHFVTGL